eukprot:m51a1_g11829 putative -related protein kinase 2 (692) ;mRNA; f:434179-436828
MSAKDFQKDKFLGKGTYGAVYRVTRVSTGKVYALKEVDMRNKRQDENEEAVNEIRLLASVKHQNIIRYRESFFENDHLFIITDFADAGDVSGLINRHKQVHSMIKEEEVWSIFMQLCLGIKYLHAHHILHRDLKTSNVFLTGPHPHAVKIGDLGVAKLLKAAATQTQVGTPYYISPEIWRKLPYNEKSDVWSLGCVLYEMCTFRHPFTATSPKELSAKILRGKYAPVVGYSKDMCSMIDCLLCVDTSRRPNINGVLAHPAMVARFPNIDRSHSSPVRTTSAPDHVFNTIKVPRNLTRLTTALPPPAYVTPAGPVAATALSSNRRSDPTTAVVRKLDFDAVMEPPHPSTMPEKPVAAEPQAFAVPVAPVRAPVPAAPRSESGFAVPVAPARPAYRPSSAAMGLFGPVPAQNAAPAPHAIAVPCRPPIASGLGLARRPSAPIRRPDSRALYGLQGGAAGLVRPFEFAPAHANRAPALPAAPHYAAPSGAAPHHAAAPVASVPHYAAPLGTGSSSSSSSSSSRGSQRSPHYAEPIPRHRASSVHHKPASPPRIVEVRAAQPRLSSRESARHQALMDFQHQRRSRLSLAQPLQQPLRDVSNVGGAKPEDAKPVVQAQALAQAPSAHAAVGSRITRSSSSAAVYARPRQSMGAPLRRSPSELGLLNPRMAPPAVGAVPGLYGPDRPDRFRRPSVVF